MIFAVMGVRVRPGATQLTRMFLGAYLQAGWGRPGAGGGNERKHQKGGHCSHYAVKWGAGVRQSGHTGMTT